MGRAHRLALYPYTKHTPLIVVLSVKWERSDSATVRKHILSILESLVESQISGFKKKKHTRGKCMYSGLQKMRRERLLGSWHRSHPHIT